MFEYKIDTNILPIVYVTWMSIKGGEFNKRYWLNCATGKKKDKPEKWMYYDDESDIGRCYYRNTERTRLGLNYYTSKRDKIWVNSGSSVKYAYAKYHKDIDMLEIAAVGIDTTRKEEVHEWKYLGDRFFINRKKVILNQNGNRDNSYYLYEDHTAWNGNSLLGMLNRLNYNDYAIDELCGRRSSGNVTTL